MSCFNVFAYHSWSCHIAEWMLAITQDVVDQHAYHLDRTILPADVTTGSGSFANGRERIKTWMSLFFGEELALHRFSSVDCQHRCSVVDIQETISLVLFIVCSISTMMDINAIT